MNHVIEQLEALSKKEVLRPIDVELCRFLQERHPNITGEVMIAAALCSYLYRQGHVCLPLDDYAGKELFKELSPDTVLKSPSQNKWKEALQECNAVGSPGDYKPFVLDTSSRLYMHKLWHYEHRLAEELIRKKNQRTQKVDEGVLQEGLKRLFNSSGEQPDWQQVAAALSVRNKLSIISGGPGTGKTSTVVRVLALLLEQYQQKEQFPDIALAAPTGKAAARLKDSIVKAKSELNINDKIRYAIPEKARTIHQLLGARRHSSQFRHNEDNPVPYDLVIVDEASMIDQALMSKLVNALFDEAKLILLGDKDQLASVEAGSVLGDICDITRNNYSQEQAEWLQNLGIDIPSKAITKGPKVLTDNITLLTKSYRFTADSGISQLSQKVNAGASRQAMQVLKSDKYKDVSFQNVSSTARLKELLSAKFPDYFRSILDAQSPEQALKAFNSFRIISAHRKGPNGIIHLNNLVRDILQKEGLIPKYAHWYPGKPVIINVNDYTLELFNGDTGICLPNENGELSIYFESEGELRAIAPARLPEHTTAFALTVHKSQGSEFDDVMLILPRTTSQVMSRELIYTAITRARTTMMIAGDERILRESIEHQIRRSSGLRDYLWA